MLINLRNAMMAGKRKPTAKDYVQNGLVAMWDGIENAGWGVHDASATTWKNLAGNDYNLDVVNGATFGDDHIICNQTNKPVATSSQHIPSVNNVFVEFVFDKTTTATYAFALYTSLNYGIIAFKQNGVVFASNGGTSRSIDLGGNTFTGSISFDYNTVKKYKNGQEVESGSYNESWGGIQDNIAVGGRLNSSSSVFRGKIYAIRIYSRALTAEEVARNYAIDKARFHLP